MEQAEPHQEQDKGLPEPPDELLQEIIEELGLHETDNSDEIKGILKNHAVAFAIGRVIERRSPTMHEDVARARTVARLAKELGEEIGSFGLTLQFFLQVDELDEGGKTLDLDVTCSDLREIVKICSRVGQSRPAKTQPDRILKNAVGGMMLVLEMMTGERASVQQRRSDEGLPPKLISPESRAIAALLRFAEPGLADTTIVNVITSIRAEFRDRPLSGFKFQLMLGAPVYATPAV